MDSQPAMLETVTGSTSDTVGNCSSSSSSSSSSSDSILNIGQSGASSISTSNSDSKPDPSIFAYVQQLQEEKKILEGRIRGYNTLGNIVNELKLENSKLKAQIMELQTKEKQVASTNFRQELPLDLAVIKVSEHASENKEGTSVALTGTTAICSSLNAIQKSPSMMGCGESSQNGENFDTEETKVMPLPNRKSASCDENMPLPNRKSASCDENIPLPNSKSASCDENMPMQESLGPESRSASESEEHSSSNDNISKSAQRGSSNGSSPDLLQLDSSKYEDATYEKVGFDYTSSLYGPGPSVVRPLDFPSLSSGETAGRFHRIPDISTSSSHLNMSLHNSFIGQASDAQPPCLAAQVESSDPGDSSPAIACQMHDIAEQIAQLERRDRKSKKLIDTLLQENHDLKTRLRQSSNTYSAHTVAMKDEILHLHQQLKHINPDHVESTPLKSPVLTSLAGDWIHVEEPLISGDSSNQQLVNRVRQLEKDKAELKRANSNWKSQWETLKLDQQMESQNLQMQINTLKTQLAEQSLRNEACLLEAKKHCEEEETAKEEATHFRLLAERESLELREKMTEVRAQLSDTVRQKQALVTELSILKARYASPDKQRSSSPTDSSSALKTENAVLRQQLALFAEDFEQERRDRTAAQAARDESKKQVDVLTLKNQQLSQQITNLKRQLQNRDDTIATTLHRNESLQMQITELNRKLHSEKESKQLLHRKLAMLQQQTTYNQHRTSSHRPSPANYQQPQYTAYNRQMNNTGVPYPEHLPGAWTCTSCTYVNYPGRTVCEMCGIVSNHTSQPDPFGYPSNSSSWDHPLLMSRGNSYNQQQLGASTGDLVADSSA